LKKITFALIVILVILLLPPASAQGEIKSTVIQVYPEGYVKVTEIIQADNYTIGTLVDLLAGNVTALTVLDERGNPLTFQQNGSKLAIYYGENVSLINVTYYTNELTSKEGSVWTLSYSFNHPVKIILPPGSVVVDLSTVPLEIGESYIVLPPGNQSISYVLSIPTESETSTTSSETTTTPTTRGGNVSTPQKTSPRGTLTGNEGSTGKNSSVYYLLGSLAVVIGLGLTLLYSRGAKNGELPSREELERRMNEAGLNDDERRVLEYVYDRGGRARQSEVRNALGIPKTTAWRMFQRLEKRGLIRVYKKGKENWVELRL